MRRTAHLTLLVALVASLAAALPAGAATPASGAGFLYGGLYADQYDASVVLDAANAFTGRPHTFGGLFTVVESGAANTDRILEEQWESKSTPFVNVTSSDNLDVSLAKIKQWAQGVKGWVDRGGDRSLIVAPFQEMNGSWTPWGCQPAKWKATYQRFRQAFAEVGLDERSVRWSFAPNGYSSPECNAGMSAYYPGDASTDIVAFSSYNYGPKNWDGGYWGAAKVFGPYLDEIRAYAPNKPVIVAQTGTAPQGGDANAWLRESYAYLAADASVVGAIYFNIDKSAFGGNEWDWRVFFGSGDARNKPGYRDAMKGAGTAYAWPLRSWFTPGPLDFGDVRRAAGPTRVSTAVAASQNAFSSASTVVLAPQGRYAFALLGGPLAAKGDGPVLLTYQDQLRDGVDTELQRLSPDLVYILGTTADISAAVQSQVEGLGFTTQRIDSSDEFELGRRIANLVGGTSVYVAEGRNVDPNRGWPDALSISALASYQGRPLILVERDSLPAASRQALQQLGVTNATIVGGTAAVSDAVAQAIESEGVTLGPRLAGDGRYDTSIAVAEASVAAGMNPARTWFATGANWPDALAGGAAVAQNGGVLVLAHGPDFDASPKSRAWLQQRGVTTLYLLGGHAAIGLHVEAEGLGVVP